MLTSTGFKRMRTADYIPIIQEQARELFGEDADVSDLTPLGKLIYLQAQQRAEDNELLEQVYNARFVDTSFGASLEANVKRALITKKRWNKATGLITVTLEKGASIPQGDLFGTNYNVYFRTLDAFEASDNGEYQLKVECTQYGAIGNVEIGDISVIGNPRKGVLSVTNENAFFNGQNEETDEELQDRYYQSLSKTGTRRIEAIEANVLDEVTGVQSCIAIENDTNVMDAEGRPAHSFETIVLGGNDVEVAQAIFEKKPGGIRAFGRTYHHIFLDNRGLEHMISFTRATNVPIYIKIYKRINALYPSNGDQLLIEKAIEYVGGTYNGTLYNGVGMSTDVILARLESRLFAIDGLVDVRVELSTDNVNFDQSNIRILFPEVAETDSSKVEVLRIE